MIRHLVEDKTGNDARIRVRELIRATNIYFSVKTSQFYVKEIQGTDRCHGIHRIDTGRNWITPKVKGQGHAHNRPQGPKGVPGRLRPRIFFKFGTTRV
jgi:hypothetical protein